MNAIVSGQAERAVVGEGVSWSLLSTDVTEEPVVLRRCDLREVFHEADDLEFVAVASVDEARARLTVACDREEALLLALNLLDGELSHETRQEVADDLEAFLAEGAGEFVAAVLFARPLGEAHDLAGALELELGARTRGLFEELARAQSSIEAVWLAWEAVPDAALEQTDRATVRATLVRGGWFARLVRAHAAGAGVDGEVGRLLVEPSLRAQKGLRAVATAWVRPLRVASPTPRPVEMREDEEDPEEEEEGKERRTSLDRGAQFERVMRQKEAIVAALDRRNTTRAMELVGDLVATQLHTDGGARYAVKSLCDLAQKAKARGLRGVQLALTTRAIDVAPEDGWSWTQHADALRLNGRAADALEASRRARAIFERGVRECSSAVGVDYFRTSLAVLALRERRHRDVVEQLQQVTTPALTVPAKVLQLHAYGLVGNQRETKRCHDAIPANLAGATRAVLDELVRRYVRRQPPQNDDAWLLLKESEMVSDAFAAAA